MDVNADTAATRDFGGRVEMVQIQMTLPKRIMDAMRAEAAEIGVTPNILARIRLCSMFHGHGGEAKRKAYIVKLENWREAEAYVRVKLPGSSVSDLAAKAVTSEMRKHGPKSAQKAEFDRLLGK
jgi:hypothetical protein